MRSIVENKVQTEEKRKRTNGYIAIFLLLILVLSTAGYAFYYNASESTNAPTDTTTGNVSEMKLQKIGSKWAVPFRGQYLYLSYGPEEVNNIPVSINRTVFDYYGTFLYVDSNNTAEYEEVSTTIGKFVSGIQPACYGKCEQNLPEKQCDSNLIVVKKSSVPKVSQQDQCIFVDGDLKALDAFLYKILVIEG